MKGKMCFRVVSLLRSWLGMAIIHDFDLDRYLFSLQFILLGFVICSMITVVSGFISRQFQSYRNLSVGLQKEWRCRVVAFVHCLFAVVAMMYSAVTFPHEVDDLGMIRGDSDALRITESLCCGYFVWDTLIMLYYWNSPGTDYFSIQGLIHGSMCATVYLTSLRPFGMYLTGLHLFFEFSTPFLHIRWFLIKTGMAGSSFAIANDYTFVFMFFIARVVMGPIYFYKYLQTMIMLPWDPLNYVFITSIFISNALNYFWFYLIVHSALVATPAEKKEKSEKLKKKKQKKKQ